MRFTSFIVSALLGIYVVGSVQAAQRHCISGLSLGAYDVYVNDHRVHSGLNCGGQGVISFETSAGGAIRIVRAGSTSVEDLASSADWLTLSPNPTVGQVSLTWSMEGSEEASLAVYDASGRQIGPVLHREGRAGRNVWPIDLDAMAHPRVAAGVYFVKLRVEDDVRTTRVVVLPAR